MATTYKIFQQKSKSTHPIVLVAAIGITTFSILGSAVITGLIPASKQAVTVNSGILSQRAIIQPLPSPEAKLLSLRPDGKSQSEVMSELNFLGNMHSL